MNDTPVFPVESLTSRERQVARAVSQGLRNRQIASEFGISEETVKKHLATIYGKLALEGRVALAVHVIQAGARGLYSADTAAISMRPVGSTHETKNPRAGSTAIGTAMFITT